MYNMRDSVVELLLRMSLFVLSMGGTRLVSFRNQNRLSKCRFTVALRDIAYFFSFYFLAEKLEVCGSRVRDSLGNFFHSIHLLLELRESQEYEKTWLVKFLVKLLPESLKRSKKYGRKFAECFTFFQLTLSVPDVEKYEIKKKRRKKETSTLGKSYAFLLILQLVTRPLSPVSRIHYSLFSLSKVLLRFVHRPHDAAE